MNRGDVEPQSPRFHPLGTLLSFRMDLISLLYTSASPVTEAKRGRLFKAQIESTAKSRQLAALSMHRSPTLA